MLNSCARSLPGIKYVAQGFALGLVDGLTACPSGGLDQILDFGFHEGAENARVLYPWVGMENGKITRLKNVLDDASGKNQAAADRYYHQLHLKPWAKGLWNVQG